MGDRPGRGPRDSHQWPAQHLNGAPPPPWAGSAPPSHARNAFAGGERGRGGMGGPWGGRGPAPGPPGVPDEDGLDAGPPGSGAVPARFAPGHGGRFGPVGGPVGGRGAWGSHAGPPAGFAGAGGAPDGPHGPARGPPGLNGGMDAGRFAPGGPSRDMSSRDLRNSQHVGGRGMAAPGPAHKQLVPAPGGGWEVAVRPAAPPLAAQGLAPGRGLLPMPQQGAGGAGTPPFQGPADRGPGHMDAPRGMFPPGAAGFGPGPMAAQVGRQSFGPSQGPGLMGPPVLPSGGGGPMQGAGVWEGYPPGPPRPSPADAAVLARRRRSLLARVRRQALGVHVVPELATEKVRFPHRQDLLSWSLPNDKPDFDTLMHISSPVLWRDLCIGVLPAGCNNASITMCWETFE